MLIFCMIENKKMIKKNIFKKFNNKKTILIEFP